MSKLDDAELVALAMTQLPYVTTAYEALAKRYHGLIYRTCLGMLRNPNDAEDVTQAVLIKVFNGLPKFEQRASFKTWVLRIATNTCITAAKKKQKEQEYLEPLEDEESHGQTVPDHAEADIPFNEIIHMLDETEQRILTLRFVGESSLNEIAEIMEMGLSAVKMRFYRALEKLKSQHT